MLLWDDSKKNFFWNCFIYDLGWNVFVIWKRGKVGDINENSIDWRRTRRSWIKTFGIRISIGRVC